MEQHYNNGPEGMPRVQRMSDSTIDWVINGVDTNGMYLDQEGQRKLRNVCHAAAEEVLARVEWPERATSATGDATWSAKSYLPAITGGQSWCCANGCGVSRTKEARDEYSRTEYPDGRVESWTRRVFVSQCCGAELMLWDEAKQDFIAWEYATAQSAHLETMAPAKSDDLWQQGMSAAWDTLVKNDPEAAQRFKRDLADYARNPTPLQAGPA